MSDESNLQSCGKSMSVHPIVKIWVKNPAPMIPVPYHVGAIKYYKEKKQRTETLEYK